MKVIHTNDPTIDRLARLAFPTWKGRKLKVCEIPASGELSIIGTAWSGGSRSSYVAVNLETGATQGAASVNPLRERDSRIAVIPPGFAVVEFAVFRGKDHGCTVYLHPTNLAKLLPEDQGLSLTPHDRIVLAATRELKNTYGGESNIRFREASKQTGITSDQWEASKRTLIANGYLRKNGSITNEGRNAIGSTGLYSLRKERS